MSRVKMMIDVQIEFNADLSKIKNDTEQALALLLFSYCEEDSGTFCVREEDLYALAGNYDFDDDEVDFALKRLERKNYIYMDGGLICLSYSHKRVKDKTKIALGKFDKKWRLDK